MKPKKNFVKRWLSASLREMIDCPFQPGNLRLLKKGCLQRLEASMRWDFQNAFRNDFFYYTVKQGLIVCQSCPVKETLNSAKPATKLHRLKLKSD
ncbi:MAG: hypothetical protein V2B13_16130 [Pseudomonadota bacterium]